MQKTWNVKKPDVALQKKLAKELINSAYSTLAEFNASADPLREIARYIINRKN